MQTILHTLTESEIWSVLESVKDPEIPVLSVVDMGIITKVASRKSQVASLAHITMTPTFVGCPAIGLMKKDIYEAVKKNGLR